MTAPLRLSEDRPADRRLGLVVEDEPHTRDWLAASLNTAFDGLPVVTCATLAEARDRLRRLSASSPAQPGRPALAAAEPERLVVALIDLGLPDGSAEPLIREITDAFPDALPVVVTIYDDDDHLFAALSAGARGYLLKDAPEASLQRQLRRLRDGETPLSPGIARRILAYFHKPAVSAPSAPVPGLTAREQEVLGLLGRGLRSAEVARLLGLSEHTVAGYIKAIYGKLDISSRAEAALEAQRLGLI